MRGRESRDLVVWVVALALGVSFFLIGSGCSRGGSSGGAAGTAPEAAIQPIPRQVGDVTVDYTLQDAESHLVDIQVEYSVDGGNTFSTATEAGGDGTTGLASDPGGVSHTFIWACLTDVGPGAQTQVVVAITPRDGTAGAGAPALSSVFTVGNDAPWLELPGDIPDSGGAVSVTYDLFDTTSDVCDLAIQFSTDGGATFDPSPATPGSGSTTNLASAPGGVSHNFVWDVVADLGAGTFGFVVLQLTPSDPFDPGSYVRSNVFRIGPNTSPTAVIQPVARQVDQIQVDFTLFDADSDPVDVAFEYSLDSGQSFWAMTLSPGSPTTGLTATPTGAPHQVVWESYADIGTSATTVQVRATPSDPFGSGPASATSDFTAGNDAPVVIIDPIPSPQVGDVTVYYTIIDSTSDTVTVWVVYSPDDGAHFLPATLANTDEGTIQASEISGLTSSPSGVRHQFDWQASVDEPRPLTKALIRITPYDGIDVGVPVTSNSFAVTN